MEREWWIVEVRHPTSLDSSVLSNLMVFSGEGATYPSDIHHPDLWLILNGGHRLSDGWIGRASAMHYKPAQRPHGATFTEYLP